MIKRYELSIHYGVPSVEMCTNGEYILHADHVAEVESLRAKLKAMEWQPIETAPRDGTPILLGREPQEDDDDGISTLGLWQDALEDGVDYMGGDAGFVDHQYQVFNPGRSFGNRQYSATQPTRWMPLPPHPQE